MSPRSQVCHSCQRWAKDGLIDSDNLASPKAQLSQAHNEDDRVKTILNLRVKGTCDWIFDYDTYKAWLKSYSPSLLWLYGDPGTGKTMLASAVIADLQSNQDAVVYYLFDSRDDKLSTITGLLTSLITQLKQIRPRLPSDGPRLPQRTCNPITTLFNEFSEIVMGFEELYCCIDAVDEADEWRMTLVRSISDLVNLEASPVKFFLTSRSLYMLFPFSEVAFMIQLPNNETIRDTREVICSNIEALRQQGKIIRGKQIES